MRIYKQLLLLAASLLLTACAQEPLEQVLAGKTMGTSWSVKYIGNQEVTQEELTAEIQTELNRIEAAMSNWQEDSDVSKFNRLSQGCLLVSEDTVTVARASQTISQLSDGYFDPTVSPLIEVWGFGVGNQPPEEPEPELLESLLANTGYENFSVSDRQLCKNDADTHLNFSAIAKGYAVDQVADVLISNNIDRFLVEVGGELYGLGENSQNENWSVGVETPSFGWPQGVYSILHLNGNAVATSGDYRNYYELGDHTYSHILNPRTGRPVIHNAASVTVIHESTMMADGWATALLAAGPEEGIRLANKAGISAYMILRDGEEFTSTQSQYWPESTNNRE